MARPRTTLRRFFRHIAVTVLGVAGVLWDKLVFTHSRQGQLERVLTEVRDDYCPHNRSDWRRCTACTGIGRPN